MPLSPQEIERKHFLMALRGYDKEQVDAFLKELATDQQQLLGALDAARKDRNGRGPGSPNPFEGLAAQLESVLKHAAGQVDQLCSAAADDVARQLAAARREVAKAATTRAAAEQQTAEARRDLENARRVKERAESQATATMEGARRKVHELNGEIRAGVQRVEELRKAAAEESARAGRLRAAAEREAAEVRGAAERKAAEVRDAAEREAAEVRGAAEREAAEVRDAAEREAAELQDAANWACRESAKVLEAAEEELCTAFQLRAEREQDIGIPHAVEPSNRTESGLGPEGDRGDSSRPTTTRTWLPFADK